MISINIYLYCERDSRYNKPEVRVVKRREARLSTVVNLVACLSTRTERATTAFPPTALHFTSPHFPQHKHKTLLHLKQEKIIVIKG
ncbi:unnamed protein product [Leptosia nina]|uniref:Uncharacterized protein n=1 Tax=Leptosia nina TaxID=320188 RepID=A0AAV1JI09_9NEOP